MILTSGATKIHTTLPEEGLGLIHKQVANLLEHSFLQDLYGYEDRPQITVRYYQQVRHFVVLSDRWRPIPRNLARS